MEGWVVDEVRWEIRHIWVGDERVRWKWLGGGWDGWAVRWRSWLIIYLCCVCVAAWYPSWQRTQIQMAWCLASCRLTTHSGTRRAALSSEHPPLRDSMVSMKQHWITSLWHWYNQLINSMNGHFVKNVG